MRNPFDPVRRRRRRRQVVGGGLIALIAAAIGLWRGGGVGARTSGSGCGPGEVRVDGRCVSSRIAAGGKVDLNIASADEIATIPGLGPDLAAAIISARSRLGRFETFEQLDTVPGIGPAKLQAIKDHAVLR